jgi:competence protein ComEC
MYEAKITKIQRYEHGDIAREIRDWFADVIRRVIPSPESDLGIGFLVGQKTALPSDVLDALKIAGLTHVVVASGYNLTILVRLARRLFMKISKYMSLAGASGLVLCFVMVTGASPSMTRAAIVTGLSLAAWYYGRNIHPVVLLLLSAAVTVYIEPRFAWGDAGWLLSFTAFAGVLIVAPLLQSYFFGETKPGVVRQILGETFSAQLLTMPIIMYMFGTVSFVALLANVAVLPFVPLAMLLVFLAGIMGLIYMPLAAVFGHLAYWLLGYMVWVTKQLAEFSWASSEIAVPLLGVIGMYISIAVIVVYLRRATNYKLSRANIVE